MPTDQFNRAYLAKRITQYHDTVFASLDDEMAAMLKAYANASKEVLDEMARLYGQYGQSGSLPLTEMYRFGRLEKLNAELVDIGTSLGGTQQQFMKSTLPSLYQGSAGFSYGLFEVAFAKVPKSRIDKLLAYPWSGANFSERIWADKELLIRNLRQTAVRGMVQGSSFTTMSQELMDRMKASAVNARRLVRTESMFFINQAQLDSYTDLGVKQVEYLTANDERTCDICSPFNGRVYPVDDAPIVPQHPNCRCTWIPVVPPKR